MHPMDVGRFTKRIHVAALVESMCEYCLDGDFQLTVAISPP